MVAVVSPDQAEPGYVAEGFGSVWTATTDNKLNRVDPATSKILASIALEDGAQDIGNGVVVTQTAVWVIQNDKAEMIKVDPATNEVVSKTPWTKLIDQAKAKTTVPVGKGTDFMWLQMAGDEGGGGVVEKGLLRIDPNSGAALTFLPYSPDQSGDGRLAITDEALWYGAWWSHLPDQCRHQCNRCDVHDLAGDHSPGHWFWVRLGGELRTKSRPAAGRCTVSTSRALRAQRI